MPRLPFHQTAQIDIVKLSDYCLNPNHPRGRHKARQFSAVLGLNQGDAAWLASAISMGLANHDAVFQTEDTYGQRWHADMLLTRQAKRAVIRTAW